MSDNISVLIVEDDPIIAADLTYFMQDFGYSPFPAVSSAEQALLLLKNVVPDFILMDVTLDGDIDGISLAETINRSYSIPIIFLTAHHDRNTIDRIKATQPSAYLVKPLQEHNLQTSIELALYNYSHEKLVQKPSDASDNDFISGRHFFVKIKNQLKKVLLEDILFVEAYDNYSFIHTKEKKYLIGSNLKSVEAKLVDYQFVRTHRSTIVNLKVIDGIEEDVIIIGNHQLPIGKTYREDFMKRINLL